MKIFLSSLLIAASFTAIAQPMDTRTGDASTITTFRGGLGAAKALQIPAADTVPWRGETPTPYTVVIRPQDSLLYYHNGGRWKTAGGGSTGGVKTSAPSKQVLYGTGDGVTSSQYFVYDATTGRIGVGTPNPQYLFHGEFSAALAESQFGSMFFRNLNSDGYTAATYRNDADFFTQLLVSGSAMPGLGNGIRANGASLLTNSPAGLNITTLGVGPISMFAAGVGIGTNTPLGKLHVNDGPLVLDKDYGFVSDGFNEGGRTKIWGLTAEYENYGMSYLEGGHDVISFHPNGAPYNPGLAVSGSGFVGVGTVAPATLLEVYDTDAGDMVSLWSNYPQNVPAILRWRDGSATTGQIATVYNGFSVDMQFGNLYGKGLYNTTTALTIQGGTDNVGIGTTTPAEKLDVSGGNLRIENGYLILTDRSTTTPYRLFIDNGKLGWETF